MAQRYIKSNKYTGVYYDVLLNNDKVYYITYKDNSRKKWLKIGLHSEGIRENYCHQKRNEIVNKLRLGEVPEPVAKKLKTKTKNDLQKIADEYFETRKEGSAKNTDISIFKNHIIKYFDDIDLITKQDIIKWKKRLQETKVQNKQKLLSDKSVNNILSLLITVNRYAIKNDLTTNDFTKYIIKDEIDNARERFLSKEEIIELFNYVSNDEKLLLFYKLALTTGARLNSILTIKKQDIDFTHKLITLKDHKNNTTYKGFLRDDVIELLKNRVNGLQQNELLFKRNPQRRLREKLNDLFNEGIDEFDTKNKVVFHTLRHTFASHLAINGTPIFTIQKLMNHKDIKMTMRYAKLAPDSGRESVECLDF